MPQPQPPHIDPQSVAQWVDQHVQGFSDDNAGVARAVNFSLDLGKGPAQRVTLGANGLVITLINPRASSAANSPIAQRMRLLVRQDATGSRTLPTFSPALNYGTAGAPTLTTTASKTDIFDLTSLDGGVTWLCTGVTKGF